MVAHWLSRCLWTGRSWVRIPLYSHHARDLGQVLHLQLPVVLRRVNSDTGSIAVVGSASEMDKYNTINTIQLKSAVVKLTCVLNSAEIMVKLMINAPITRSCAVVNPA